MSDCRECKRLQAFLEQQAKEIARLRKQCREFIWAEDNPEEYESELSKAKAELARLREVARAAYIEGHQDASARPRDMRLKAWLESNSRAAIEGGE